MITEDYISFETAKLLKEKGFDEPCTVSFFDKDNYREWIETAPRPLYVDSESAKPFTYQRPTLQMAMKWVQETFNIVIIPNYEYECDDTPWCYKIFKLGENGKPERVAVKGVSYDKDNNPTEHIVSYRDYERSYKDYSTKEEAIEEGIKYCLENLI